MALEQQPPTEPRIPAVHALEDDAVGLADTVKRPKIIPPVQTVATGALGSRLAQQRGLAAEVQAATPLAQRMMPQLVTGRLDADDVYRVRVPSFGDPTQMDTGRLDLTTIGTTKLTSPDPEVEISTRILAQQTDGSDGQAWRKSHGIVFGETTIEEMEMRVGTYSGELDRKKQSSSYRQLSLPGFSGRFPVRATRVLSDLQEALILLISSKKEVALEVQPEPFLRRYVSLPVDTLLIHEGNVPPMEKAKQIFLRLVGRGQAMSQPEVQRVTELQELFVEDQGELSGGGRALQLLMPWEEEEYARRWYLAHRDESWGMASSEDTVQSVEQAPYTPKTSVNPIMRDGVLCYGGLLEIDYTPSTEPNPSPMREVYRREVNAAFPSFSVANSIDALSPQTMHELCSDSNTVTTQINSFKPVPSTMETIMDALEMYYTSHPGDLHGYDAGSIGMAPLAIGLQ